MFFCVFLSTTESRVLYRDKVAGSLGEGSRSWLRWSRVDINIHENTSIPVINSAF